MLAVWDRRATICPKTPPRGYTYSHSRRGSCYGQIAIGLSRMRLMSPSQILHDNKNISQESPLGDPGYKRIFEEVQGAWNVDQASSQCVAISQNVFKVQDEVSYLAMAASEEPAMLALDVVRL